MISGDGSRKEILTIGHFFSVPEICHRFTYFTTSLEIWEEKIEKKY